MAVARREFLGTVVTGSLLAALPVDLRSAELVDHRRPANGAWDVTWVERLRGRSRALFDSPEISDGWAVYRACIWRAQYAEVYGVPPTDLTPVVVLRHNAIVLAMNDEYWNRFDVGKKSRIRDESTGKWYKTNPVSVAPSGGPPDWADFNLPRLISSGGIVLACDLAFREVISEFRKKDKLSDDDAARVAREHLVPGVILQPSGVFAVLRAQDEGCKYILGSDAA